MTNKDSLGYSRPDPRRKARKSYREAVHSAAICIHCADDREQARETVMGLIEAIYALDRTDSLPDIDDALAALGERMARYKLTAA